MKWTTKALIQRTLSRTPAGGTVYFWGQKWFGGYRHFTIDQKVQQGMVLAESLFQSGQTFSGRRTVEIGCGWTPVVPLLFWMYGQEECHTYDVSRLLRRSLMLETVRQIGEFHGLDRDLPDGEHRERLRKRAAILADLARLRAATGDILARCSIVYHAPHDASATGLANGSIDVVYSNTVLEHIPEEALAGLFAEAHRVLRPGGHMLHLIDLSDHFSHGDPTISSINFLRFSEASFSKYNTTFLYQNRLRSHQWRRIFEDSGFEIRVWQEIRDAGIRSLLPRFPLDRAFAHLSEEELCIGSIRVVATRA